MSDIQGIPEGIHALTPYLVCDGAARAIDFYARAFGATEVLRLPWPDGRIMHATLRIGDSALMLCDLFPEMGGKDPRAIGGSPVTIHLYVADVDRTLGRAVEAGAKVTQAVADMPWGDRYGRLEDPFGHQWSVATHLRDVDPADILAAMGGGCPGEATP